MFYYPFVQNPAKFTEVQQAEQMKFFERYYDPKNWAGYSHHFNNLTSTGCIKNAGYVYNMQDRLKKYMYRTDFGIQTAWAPNQAALRSVCHLGRGVKIVPCPAGF